MLCNHLYLCHISTVQVRRSNIIAFGIKLKNTPKNCTWKFFSVYHALCTVKKLQTYQSRKAHILIGVGCR